MEQRTLDVELISGIDLKDVNLFTKMSVYAVVSLHVDGCHDEQKTKTSVVGDCGTNPKWNNASLNFTLNERLVQENRLSLVFNLFCHRTVRDKHIGHAVVPVKELFDTMVDPDKSTMTFADYQVFRPSKKPKGELQFSYKFGDKVAVALPPGPAPLVAGYDCGYPPDHASSFAADSGYPSYLGGPKYKYFALPQPGYGYPASPPPGYYEYPPLQQPLVQQKKKSKLGSRLGPRFLEGMLGCVLIGAVVGAATGCAAGCAGESGDGYEGDNWGDNWGGGVGGCGGCGA